ncbi:MAG: AzlD domain-containing protein [Lachnospiraceae bacterium]|nr:AzlD domain-containing protein [Lachnospiraceae bacterium]
MSHNAVIYILIMALTTYLIRVLPLTLIRREIKNPVIRSFLYYVPYVTLSVMTFPAIVSATNSPVSGALAFAAGIIAAWAGLPLLQVSVLSCLVVFITELFL